MRLGGMTEEKNTFYFLDEKKKNQNLITKELSLHRRHKVSAISQTEREICIFIIACVTSTRDDHRTGRET